MSVSDLIFRPEAVTAVTVMGSSIVIGKSLMKLQEASKGLGKQLRKLDRRIAKREEGIPETRERIKDLALAIKPLKNKVRTLNLYYDKLNEIDHESRGQGRSGSRKEGNQIKGKRGCPGQRPAPLRIRLMLSLQPYSVPSRAR